MCLKKKLNLKLFFKMETQMQKMNVWIQRRKADRMNWEIGVDIYTLLYIKLITNKGLQYSTQPLIGQLVDWRTADE